MPIAENRRARFDYHIEERFEAGMVLRLETPYYAHGWGGAQVKDTVLVARDGARVMNRSRRGLLVLD